MPGMEDRLDAVVVGGAGVDTNVYLAGDDIDWAVETNFTRNVDCVGQAGGYSSRLFARLGKRTGYIGPVGDDQGGRLVRDTLARDGVDLTGLFVDPGGTNRSVNLVYRDGRRKNFWRLAGAALCRIPEHHLGRRGRLGPDGGQATAGFDDGMNQQLLQLPPDTKERTRDIRLLFKSNSA